jgi:uncharacterized protein (TIGR03435 family)
MRLATEAIAVLMSVVAFAQSPPPTSFDAASIKPSRERIGSSSWDGHPGSIVLRGQTLKSLIAIAYGVKEGQVLGGPKWLDASRFDITARANVPVRDPQLLAMLQTLLSERFRLVVHREKKFDTAYALVTDKRGLKISPVEGGRRSENNYGRGRISAHGVTMGGLADALSRLIGTTVYDRTGVVGAFDFQLEWPTEGDATDVASVISGVLQDQLGLRLELRKLPVDFLVVDQAEKPTED